ncbi:MAG TPA: CRTAC1 family protein [Vicinamibacteria bacterium]|nr:CRTAC1 family protein [Vicinamibacteria bacterium]
MKAVLSLALAALPVAVALSEDALPFAITNVAEQAGLTALTVFGGKEQNRYLLETTGCGAAFFDYDNDGWLDAFLVNGSTLEGFPRGQEPTNHLYRNRGDSTFEDVTDRAGLGGRGWGQGVCTGDYDNDGFEDLYVTYYGQSRLYRNRGDATFEDVTARAGLTETRLRWGTGCAFVDYDRDGRLDLFVANYIDLDLKTAPVPESGLCRYRGIKVACGPPGLVGGRNALYRNRGDSSFEDVSDSAGITKASGTYGLGVSTLDFDDDGWTDVYVANDSNPCTLYRNRGDTTFEDIAIAAACAFSVDGKNQAGMGVAVGDYDRNGTLDIFKTNFAGDTSTLYANSGDGNCEDRTYASGAGLNTRWLGWGVGFLDLDNDGWLDLFLANGHVYPEAWQIPGEASYKQRKVVYWNRGGARLEDVTERLGAPVTTPEAARGAAFGDFDNDGSVDVLVNNVNDTPDLYRVVSKGSHWITLKLVGTRSNRSAIGARVRCAAAGAVLEDEVRGGGSYISQNDRRLHFGLGRTTRVETVRVRWPSGLVESWSDVAADQFLTLKEGAGTPAKWEAAR